MHQYLFVCCSLGQSQVLSYWKQGITSEQKVLRLKILVLLSHSWHLRAVRHFKEAGNEPLQIRLALRNCQWQGLSHCLLDLFTFCIYYTWILFEGWVGGWKRINLSKTSIKAGCIFMHVALNCNLNVSGLPLTSNLKVIEFSQSSFAF